MTRLSIAVAASLLPFLAACASDGDHVQEPVSAEVSGEAEEELDPNDPNVLMCPVTGVMQRIDEDADGHGSEMEGHELPHGGDMDDN